MTPVRGVLVDLDDTLYPQAEYLALAWYAVAECGARLGLDRGRLHAALIAAAAAGSARGGIIDEAVRQLGETSSAGTASWSRSWWLPSTASARGG